MMMMVGNDNYVGDDYIALMKVVMMIMMMVQALLMIVTNHSFVSVFLDKKHEAIILPLFGIATPFHISTIKVSQ